MIDKPWNKWDRWDWSAALIEFHFGTESGQASPVDHIHASADALGACAGADPSEREAVKDHFLSRMNNAARQYVPWNQCCGDPTSWYAFLVAVCAVFADEDLAEENQYLATISSRLGPNYVRELERLPEAWRSLAAWLSERPGYYRQLVVPDPGGWTRIGHAKKLAFPRRGDINALSESALKLGIGDDPSVADARLLAERASRLSASAIEERDKFAELVESGAPPVKLYDTSWWGAIRTACRASLQKDSAERGEYGILVFQNEDDAEVCVVLQTSSEPETDSWALIEGYDPWTHFCDKLDILRAALNGGKGFGRVGALARNGIIPLQNSLHWETFPAGRGEPTGFLLSSAKLADLQGESCESVPVTGTDWHLLPAGTLPIYNEGSRRPTSRRIATVGGVRVGPSRYLNDAGLLPRVQAPWATDVRAEIAGGQTVELTRTDTGWVFEMNRTYTGPVLISASSESAKSSLKIDFVHTVARSEPRHVRNTQSWMIEGALGAQSLSDTPCHDTMCTLPSSRSLLLGSVVGTGAASLNEAAWEVVTLGETNHITALGTPSETMGRSSDDGANRTWKRLLSGDIKDCEARTVANRARNAKGLPVVESACLVAKPEPVRAPDPVAERLESYLAASSNARAELPIGELHRYIASVTGAASKNDPWTRIRELEQAGLFDIAASSTWSKRRVLVRPPVLRVHRNAHSFVGVLDGLSTAAMRAEMLTAAKEIGARPYLLQSFSALATRTVGLNPGGFDQLKEIARRTRISIEFIGTDLLPNRSPFYDLQPGLPSNHTPWGVPFEFPAAPGVSVQLFRLEGSPDWYVVDLPRGAIRVRLRSTAEQIAAASIGTLELSQRGPDLLCNVSLPLPAARWITCLGGARPGYDPLNHRWCYRLPNTPAAKSSAQSLHQWIADLSNWSSPC